MTSDYEAEPVPLFVAGWSRTTAARCDVERTRDTTTGARTVIDVPLFPFPDPRKVAFSGDLHANAARAAQVLRDAKRRDADVVVQLGDFGFWHGDEGLHYRMYVNQQAERAGVPVIFIDGNHENFELLESLPLEAGGYRVLGSHLFHAPRNLRWVWDGVRFCAFGGATSLDRDRRVEGWNWWPQESHTVDQLGALVAGGVCDVLVSHDCPAGVAITGIGHRVPSSLWSPSELERAWAHRERFAEAVAQINPTHLFHGHFHRFHRSEVMSFGVMTEVIGLADDRGDRDELTVVVDLAELSDSIDRRRIAGVGASVGEVPTIEKKSHRA